MGVKTGEFLDSPSGHRKLVTGLNGLARPFNQHIPYKFQTICRLSDFGGLH